MTLVERARDHAERMPVAFAPHGGGPWPFVDMGMPKSEVDELATYLRVVRCVGQDPREGPVADRAVRLALRAAGFV